MCGVGGLDREGGLAKTKRREAEQKMMGGGGRQKNVFLPRLCDFRIAVLKILESRRRGR